MFFSFIDLKIINKLIPQKISICCKSGIKKMKIEDVLKGAGDQGICANTYRNTVPWKITHFRARMPALLTAL